MKAIKMILLCAASGALGFAQLVGVPPDGNHIVGEYVGAKTPGPRAALLGQSDTILPHIATGGGWETVMVIVNLSTVSVDFTQRFFNQSGAPMQVTFRSYPDLTLTTTSVAAGHLAPGQSFNFSLFDSTPATQVGWSSLSYNATNARLGAYAIFRQFRPSGQSFEALVPVSAFDDYKFFMPFDNIQGFITAIALANPASNLTGHVTITAKDITGAFISSYTLTMPPGTQQAFSLTDRMPALANRLGTLYVESDITRLSALGIRFNGNGGLAFTSVPIMNWIGMFP